MPHFHYREQTLYVEDLPLSAVADAVSTPCYVYSATALTQAYQGYTQAFSASDHLICYAVKANSNLSILQHFARLGAGFDIVSGGELQRVLAIGADPAKIVFSGVGKSVAELKLALKTGILCFNVESISELTRLNHVAAELAVRAPISLRINPDVNANTHPYISTGLRDNKFGIAYTDAQESYRYAQTLPQLDIVGIDCHIGSQLIDTSPLIDALDRLLHLIDQLGTQGIILKHIDIGGGIGIRYQNEALPDINAYAQQVLTRLAGRNLQILLEPGRSLVGNAGVLLTRIEYLKMGQNKNFAIVDAAMNDLMRPSYYDAYHDILPVTRTETPTALFDVVGPVCESSDFLGKDRTLALKEGELLAIMSAGAYGSTMSSNYNTRPRVAEVLVTQDQMHLIRKRETFSQLIADEMTVLQP